MEYRYTAITLKKKEINETDRLYTFYTLEQGKIQVIARGVRKSHAKLAGQLENFSLVSLMVMKSRGMGNIKSAVSEVTPRYIKESYEVMRHIFRAVEIFDRVIGQDEVDVKIFTLLKNFIELQDMCARDKKLERSQLLLQAFLFQLMSLLGYTFETSHCVYCGGQIAAKDPCVSYKQGGVVCASCKTKHENVFIVSSELIKYLRLFSSNTLVSLQKVIPTKQHLQQLEVFLRDYMRWTVE